MQHVGEAARRDLKTERGPQQVHDCRQRYAQLGVQLNHKRDDPGTELHAGRPHRGGGVQDGVACSRR